MSRPSLRVFVYGTLRPGGRFHERYCAGVRTIEPAAVPGRLLRLPQGYPILHLDERLVAAVGTAEALADASAPERLGPDTAASLAPLFEHATDPMVPGEILAFDDPQARLPPLDELEDFHPGAPSLYRRVLVPARRSSDGALVLVWLYAAPR